MGDWRWFDDLRAKWTGEDLAAETDRSLAKDPGRWSSRKVEEVVEEQPTITRHDRSAGGGRPRRGGKGGQTERHSWSDADWRAAKEDYQRQNAAHEQAERDQARNLRDLARERRDAARDVRDQIRDQNRRDRDDDGGRGIFW